MILFSIFVILHIWFICETAKLFEAINEDEFKSKLEETINDMSGLFDMSGNDLSGNDISMNIPNPEDINDHINGLLKGKLGSLAAEIAEETAQELDIDIEDQENANVNKVFEKLFKNPGRLLSMVKKVGSKLDEKIKSGEIKESELMQEASQLMGKMKNIPGVKNMETLLKKMGMNNPTGMGAMGKQKINLNAMQANLNRNIRGAQQRERLLAKLQKRREEQNRREEEAKKREGYTNLTFTGNSDGKMEKSMRNLDGNETVDKKKKRKKRKKEKIKIIIDYIFNEEFWLYNPLVLFDKDHKRIISVKNYHHQKSWTTRSIILLTILDCFNEIKKLLVTSIITLVIIVILYKVQFERRKRKIEKEGT